MLRPPVPHYAIDAGEAGLLVCTGAATALCRTTDLTTGDRATGRFRAVSRDPAGCGPPAHRHRVLPVRLEPASHGEQPGNKKRRRVPAVRRNELRTDAWHTGLAARCARIGHDPDPAGGQSAVTAVRLDDHVG